VWRCGLQFSVRRQDTQHRIWPVTQNESSPQEPSPVVNCKVSCNAKETGDQRQWCLHHKTSLVARLPLNEKSRIIKRKPRWLLCHVNVGRRACEHGRKHEG